MSTKEKLMKLMESLPETRLCALLDFARFLLWLEKRGKEERDDWQGAQSRRMFHKHPLEAYGVLTVDDYRVGLSSPTVALKVNT